MINQSEPIKIKTLKIWTMSGGWGTLISAIMSFFPLVLWIAAQPLGSRFVNFSSAAISLGQISGLVGMAMMSVVIILSTRPSFMDRLFYGLNNLYKIHRNFGIISFLLLMMHPLAIAASYLPFSVYSAALFFLPSGDLSRNFGLAAILGMMAVTAVTVAANKMKYENLKSFHKFFGAVFLLSALHTMLVQSDTSRYAPLHWYMLGLSALGLAAFSYKTILERFLVKKHIYTVKEIRRLPSNTVEVVMAPIGRRMDYIAGQFAFVSFRGNKINSESHPFSISSSPRDAELRILVKSLGDYTSKMAGLPVGVRAEIEGPFGKLSYPNVKNKNQLWIGGGSGVAPFIGMARDLKRVAGRGYKIDLYYCANSQNDVVCADELSEIASSFAGFFRFIPFCQNRRGFLNAEKIRKLSGDFEGRDIFLCGPPPMVASLKKQFYQLRISKHQIHSEEFKLL